MFNNIPFKYHKNTTSSVARPSKNLPKCGNNGQGNQVDNLYSIRVKSTLTRHQTEHLHLYKINGRIRLGQAEPFRSESKQKYLPFYVRTENWWDNTENKEIGGKKWNTEHDKIIEYFPHKL
jgi:hypothetical protein